jgi:hypothetical protein
MIKGVTGGTGIVCNHGYSSYPYISTNHQNPMHGMIRLNGQDLQVYDGSNWLSLGGAYPTIDLAPDVQVAVNWAKDKMQKEQRIRELAAKHPTVKAALDAVEQAEQELVLIAELCGASTD